MARGFERQSKGEIEIMIDRDKKRKSKGVGFDRPGSEMYWQGRGNVVCSTRGGPGKSLDLH